MTHKLEVQLIRSIEGKFGTYPADTWLELTVDEGFYYVSMPGYPNMKLKRIARSNVKQIRPHSSNVQ